MVLKFLLFAAIFLFASCVAIERNNPDDPGSSYFGKGKPPVGSCAVFVEGTEREHYGKSKHQFCDVRDNKKYVYVEINGQTWMAENLNYDASDSKCYGREESNCNTYGKLYNWAAANTACPKGWRLPSNDDWIALMKSINPGCYSISAYCIRVGTNLKTANGWNDYNGTDDYGFSALPGGYGNSGGNFFDLGKNGTWWSASDYNASDAYNLAMYDNTEAISGFNIDKSSLHSVRCLMEN